MFKKQHRIFFCIMALSLLSADYAISQTINVTQNISFGEVVYVSLPGTVTITYGNSRTSDGAFVKQLSSYSRGVVTYKTTGKRYNLTLSVGNTTLTRVGGGSIQFTGGSTTPPMPSVNNNRTVTFYFGGTITLAPSLPAGEYSGTYQLTFSYN